MRSSTAKVAVAGILCICSTFWGVAAQDAMPDPAWIAPWATIGDTLSAKSVDQKFGPYWTACKDNFALVKTICFYGGTSINKKTNQPYALAGIKMTYTDGTYKSAGRFDGNGNSCTTLDVEKNELITSIKVSNIEDTDGNIDQITIVTNDPGKTAYVFGGGSGNGIHNFTTISDSNPANSVGSGHLCGFWAHAQDHYTKGETLITQLAFFFLNPIASAVITDITINLVQPVDQNGYSLMGGITQQALCQSGQTNVCSNTVSIQQGTSVSITASNTISHSQTMAFSKSVTVAKSSTSGSVGLTGASLSTVSTALTMSTSKSYTSGDSSTTTTAKTTSTVGTVTVSDSCNCPVGLDPNSYCTFYFSQRFALAWQESDWTGTAKYTLVGGATLVVATGGSTSGQMFSGDLSLTNIVCNGKSYMGPVPANGRRLVHSRDLTQTTTDNDTVANVNWQNMLDNMGNATQPMCARDGRCGVAGGGCTCGFAQCCSADGFCGSSQEQCGHGCVKAFGYCPGRVLPGEYVGSVIHACSTTPSMPIEQFCYSKPAGSHCDPSRFCEAYYDCSNLTYSCCPPDTHFNGTMCTEAGSMMPAVHLPPKGTYTCKGKTVKVCSPMATATAVVLEHIYSDGPETTYGNLTQPAYSSTACSLAALGRSRVCKNPATAYICTSLAGSRSNWAGTSGKTHDIHVCT